MSQTKIAAFHCDYTRSAIDAECYRLRVGAVELETAVFEMMNEQATKRERYGTLWEIAQAVVASELLTRPLVDL